MDGYLHSNLSILKKNITDDGDNVIVVAGQEGAGKSVFAMTIGWFLNPGMVLEDVCFNPEDFKRRVLGASKGQTIIYDEAITGMRTARWASEVYGALINLVAQIRQKNLNIILVIPSFFELGKYFAIHRSVALFLISKKDGMRGFYRAYGMDKKQKLYVKGRRDYDYKVVYSDFHGKFPKFYPVDEQKYRKKKLDEMNMEQNKKEDVADTKTLIKVREQRNALLYLLKKGDKKWTNTQLSKDLMTLSKYALDSTAITSAVDGVEERVMGGMGPLRPQ